jgi:hypothetical protein
MGTVELAAASRRTILTTIAGVLVCLAGTQALPSEFELGFRNPLDDTELSWMAQPGATQYQLLRATLKDFSADCATFETSLLYQTDATEPALGGVLHYLVRVLTPDPGSWGVASDGSVRPVSCMGPSGALVGSFGCKRGGAGGAAAPRLTQDCIEYEYLGEGLLLLNHVNTAFNCCPVFEAGITVDGDAIIVSEDEISGDCDCICLFDLNYEIVNLEPGIYDVTVIQEYLDPTDEPLDFTMDLLSSPSGMHCVDRDHYPW